MRTSIRAARASLVGLALATVGVAACSRHSTAAPPTPRDRAACSQLGAAYANFTASPGGLAPDSVYSRAITVATQADDHQLGTAISAWVIAMQHPTGKAVPGELYATAQCQRIGMPLQFRSPSPPTSNPDTSVKPEKRDNSDADDSGD